MQLGFEQLKLWPDSSNSRNASVKYLFEFYCICTEKNSTSFILIHQDTLPVQKYK